MGTLIRWSRHSALGLMLWVSACGTCSERARAPGQGEGAPEARPDPVERVQKPPCGGQHACIAAKIRRAFIRPLLVASGGRPIPAGFPELGEGGGLSRVGFFGGNMSGTESGVRQLELANREFLRRLSAYRAVDAGRALERLMLAEKDPALELLLAALASVRGSEKAAHLLLAAGCRLLGRRPCPHCGTQNLRLLTCLQVCCGGQS